MQKRSIGEKLLSEISGHFFVPDYQRGYRWSALQVDRLLDDLEIFMEERKKRSSASRYFLQPIVVKKCVAETYDYELIDGQQRLTTIYLIYAYMKREGIKPLTPQRFRFSFDANARPESAQFLEKLSLAMLDNDKEFEQNIDFFHIVQAYKRITVWIKKHGDKAGRAVDALYEALEDHAHIIWYEIPPHEDGNKLFTRLNLGKIPLTNAEIIKAWIMSPDSIKANSSEELRMRQTMLAMQWDSMEQRLRDDTFWYFITKENPQHFEPRMDLFFSMLADTEKDHDDLYNIFFSLNSKYKNNPLDLWDKVLLHYEVFNNWSEEKQLYHKIGYLLATGESPQKLINMQSDLTKEKFYEYVSKAIATKVKLPQKTTLEDLNYETHYSLLRNILLLFNVHCSMNTANPLERYPFSFHNSSVYSWSLEHIHARNADELITEDQWRKWLESHQAALTKNTRSQTDNAKQQNISQKIQTLRDGKITKDDFKETAKEIISFFEEGSNEDTDWRDSISNLALLDKDVNSALNKAVFAVKKERLLNRYKEGAYIPICTLRVFLRFYLKDQAFASNSAWTQKDRQDYLAAIREVYNMYAIETRQEAI
jgi:hypothetical protein